MNVQKVSAFRLIVKLIETHKVIVANRTLPDDGGASAFVALSFKRPRRRRLPANR